MFAPKYILSDNLVAMLTSIAESKAIIERAKILPKNEVNLRRQALLRMTHSSTEIEGNMLSLHQVEALYAKKKIDAPERDIYEVENYLKALKYIEAVVESKKPIDEKVFLKVHKLVTSKTLLTEKSGQYRTMPIYVVQRRFSMPDKIVYTGPDVDDVPRLCKDLFDWLNKSEIDGVNPIIVAGILHQEIAAIHPFADGNGRTARAMATLILYARGYDFRKLFALEDYYNNNRANYYAAISIGETYHKREVDFSPWLEYFVRGFKEEIDAVRNDMLTLSLKKADSNLNSKVFLEKDQLILLDFIDQMGRITVSDVIAILNCSRRTAQLKLLKLKTLGIIRQTGKGPSSAYILK